MREKSSERRFTKYETSLLESQDIDKSSLSPGGDYNIVRSLYHLSAQLAEGEGRLWTAAGGIGPGFSVASVKYPEIGIL